MNVDRAQYYVLLLSHCDDKNLLSATARDSNFQIYQEVGADSHSHHVRPEMTSPATLGQLRMDHHFVFEALVLKSNR